MRCDGAATHDMRCDGAAAAAWLPPLICGTTDTQSSVGHIRCAGAAAAAWLTASFDLRHKGARQSERVAYNAPARQQQPAAAWLPPSTCGTSCAWAECVTCNATARHQQLGCLAPSICCTSCTPRAYEAAAAWLTASFDPWHEKGSSSANRAPQYKVAERDGTLHDN